MTALAERVRVWVPEGVGLGGLLAVGHVRLEDDAALGAVGPLAVGLGRAARERAAAASSSLLVVPRRVTVRTARGQGEQR